MLSRALSAFAPAERACPLNKAYLLCPARLGVSEATGPYLYSTFQLNSNASQAARSSSGLLGSYLRVM